MLVVNHIKGVVTGKERVFCPLYAITRVDVIFLPYKMSCKYWSWSKV